jgi:hypothetical protein
MSSCKKSLKIPSNESIIEMIFLWFNAYDSIPFFIFSKGKPSI